MKEHKDFEERFMEPSDDNDFDQGPGVIFLGFLGVLFWCIIGVLFYIFG